MPRLKVTRKLVVTFEVDANTYQDMTVDEAVRYEKEMDQMDQIQAVIETMQFDEDVTVETSVEVIPD